MRETGLRVLCLRPAVVQSFVFESPEHPPAVESELPEQPLDESLELESPLQLPLESSLLLEEDEPHESLAAETASAAAATAGAGSEPPPELAPVPLPPCVTPLPPASGAHVSSKLEAVITTLSGDPPRLASATSAALAAVTRPAQRVTKISPGVSPPTARAASTAAPHASAANGVSPGAGRTQGLGPGAVARAPAGQASA
jgi:hypothetical protein